MSKSPDDRRAHPRYSTHLDLAVSEPSGVVARMVAKNLSLGGLYCTSSEPFEEMTRLAVRLMLPVRHGGNGETLPIDVEAVVVRSQPLPSVSGEPRFELGLFFTRMNDDDRQRIAEFIG